MAQPNPPAPEPWAALYVVPREDGRGRSCGNCVMWVRAEGGRCAIHERTQLVHRTDVCGYHVSGEPMAEWMDHPGLEPVTPEFSGLEAVGAEGTKCGSCRYYRQTGGDGTAECGGVQRPGAPEFTQARVHRDGCCARWERPQGAGARLRGMRQG